jgi:hypothetical protein
MDQNQNKPQAKIEPTQNLINDSSPSFIKIAFFTGIITLFIFMLDLQYGHVLLPQLQNDSYDTRRVLQLILILIFGLTLACNAKWRNQCIIQFTLLPKLAKYCIYGFFIMGIVSATLVGFGVDYQTLPEQAFLQVGLYISFFLCGLLISQWVQNNPKKFEQWVIFTLYTMIGLYLTMILVHIVNYHISMSSNNTDITIQNTTVWQYVMAPTFANIRFLSQFMTWTWPLLVLPLISKNNLSKASKSGLFIIISCWFFQIFMLQGRSNMLEFIIVPIVLLAMFRKKSLPWIKWQLLGIIAGFILWYLVYMFILSGGYRNVAITEHTERWFIYLACLKTALSHPLLGIGPMHLSIKLLPMGEYSGWIATPHNTLLKILAEWGIPAFILFCATACMALYKWAKLSIARVKLANISDEQYNKSALLICLSASIISGLTHCMFSGVTTMPLSQTAMVLVFGWAWGSYQLNSKNKDHIQLMRTQAKINPISHMLFILLLIYVTILIAKGVFPRAYYLTWANSISEYRTGGILAPRFWGQGVLQIFPLVHYY